MTSVWAPPLASTAASADPARPDPRMMTSVFARPLSLLLGMVVSVFLLVAGQWLGHVAGASEVLEVRSEQVVVQGWASDVGACERVVGLRRVVINGPLSSHDELLHGVHDGVQDVGSFVKTVLKLFPPRVTVHEVDLPPEIVHMLHQISKMH